MNKLADLVADATRPRTRWGRWTYVRGRVAIVHDDTDYEIDLLRCRTSAEVLDWVAQVAGKTWPTAADVGDLVRALDDLIDLQRRLCGCGTERGPVDVIAVLHGDA